MHAFEPIDEDPDSIGLHQPLLKELLQRFLLHLAHRTDPTPLVQFWNWLVGLYGMREQAPSDIWNLLPGSLQVRTIREQETRFAAILRLAANEVADAGNTCATWIAEELVKLADDRQAPGDEDAHRSDVRIVFGLHFPAGMAGHNVLRQRLRAGALVTFHLANHSRETVVERSNVFDETFLNTARSAQSDIGRDSWRLATHDWSFVLPDGDECDPVFTDGSGAMAMRVVQYLSQGGRHQDDKRWRLAPWVVISAAHDPDGKATFGTWRRVELLDAKAEVLVEEGIRVLVTPTDADGIEQTAEQFFSAKSLKPINGSSLLHVPALKRQFDRSFNRQPNHWDLADVARTHGWTQRLSSNFDRLFPDDFPHTDDLPSAFFDERKKAVIDGFDYDSDYCRPDHILDRIRDAMQQLDHRQKRSPGKGYILWSAPSGYGKTTFMDAPNDQWPADFGIVISHCVFPGPPEHVAELYTTVCKAAERYGIRVPAPPNERQRAEEARTELTLLLNRIADESLLARESSRKPRRLLLAIDGANDVGSEWKSRRTIFDVLPRPEDLPAACYVLLSTVDNERLRVAQMLAAAIEGLSVTEGAPYYASIVSSISDVGYRTLLNNYLLHNDRLKAWRPLFATILKKAQKRFLYVALYADLLRDVLPDNDPALAFSRWQIWREYLERLANETAARPYQDIPHSTTNRFDLWHKPILGLLAVAHNPISIDHLLIWLGRHPADDESRHQVHVALAEMRRVLRSHRLSTEPRYYYQLHDELRDWLCAEDNTVWSGAIEEAHSTILRASSDHEATLSPDCHRYHVLFTPMHFMSVNKHGDAWRYIQTHWQASREDNAVVGASLLHVRCQQIKILLDSAPNNDMHTLEIANCATEILCEGINVGTFQEISRPTSDTIDGYAKSLVVALDKVMTLSTRKHAGVPLDIALYYCDVQRCSGYALMHRGYYADALLAFANAAIVSYEATEILLAATDVVDRREGSPLIVTEALVRLSASLCGLGQGVLFSLKRSVDSAYLADPRLKFLPSFSDHSAVIRWCRTRSLFASQFAVAELLSRQTGVLDSNLRRLLENTDTLKELVGSTADESVNVLWECCRFGGVDGPYDRKRLRQSLISAPAVAMCVADALLLRADAEFAFDLYYSADMSLSWAISILADCAEECSDELAKPIAVLLADCISRHMPVEGVPLGNRMAKRILKFAQKVGRVEGTLLALRLHVYYADKTAIEGDSNRHWRLLARGLRIVVQAIGSTSDADGILESWRNYDAIRDVIGEFDEKLMAPNVRNSFDNATIERWQEIVRSVSRNQKGRQLSS